MQEISIRFISRDNASDINIRNEPFKLFGRMIPSYQEGQWSYTLTKNDTIGWDVFPNENYSFDIMEKDHVFIGAYDGSACIGLVILRHQWNKYMYLYDLKVNSAYRGQHIATKMMDAACGYAIEHNYRDIWTIGQNNNLAACLFYVHTGFRIGGLDTDVYIGTSQEGNADIYFYKDVNQV